MTPKEKVDGLVYEMRRLRKNRTKQAELDTELDDICVKMNKWLGSSGISTPSRLESMALNEIGKFQVEEE